MGVAAQLVRGARQAAGLTMAELAERAGMSKPTVSLYENGLVDPRADTLERLLRACGRELRAQTSQLPASAREVSGRIVGKGQPTVDDVTGIKDGRELRTAADLEAFAADLHCEGRLGT